MARAGRKLAKAPGFGVRKGVQVQHVARFDDELFGRIRDKAVRDGTSLSEAIRVLCEWGLEADEGDHA